jgi:hypothetical protein
MTELNSQEHKNSIKKVMLTKVGLRVETNVVLLQNIFLGTCYLVGVLGIGLVLTLAVVTWPQEFLQKNVLIATASANSVTLSWTAPGDDNALGQAAQYEIRYATAPITADNFSSATLVTNPPVPKIAGSSETFEVTGLESNTLYYFALKTADEVPNWSAISNVVSQRTALTDTCMPSWSCSDWSSCIDNLQTRTCIDTNECDTPVGKPETSSSCTTTPPLTPCVEKWSCTNWSDCSGGYQRRSCLDINNCGTTADKQEELIKCVVGGQEPDNPQLHFLVVTPSSHSGPQLRIYDEKLNLYSQFFTYALDFRNGVNTVLGDVDGDSSIEIVTGTGPASAPHLRIFTLKGQLKYQFFAYPTNYRTGISVAVADLDSDGLAEIITAPQDKGEPQIRVFHYSTTKKAFVLYRQFLAFPASFRMGINVVAGNLNNDGSAEIIVAPRNVGGPQVRVYRFNPIKGSFELSFQFFAYAFNFHGGVSLAVGDIDNNGINEIVTGAGPGGGPHVRIFSNKGILKYQFFAASTKFRGGLDVTTIDYNQDGADEVVTSTYSSGLPRVKIFKWLGGNNFQQKAFFYVYDPKYLWGIRVEGY